jgi:hypothetical protein
MATPTISSYETYTATSAPSYNAGRLWYDSTQNALAYYNDVTNNTLHIGEEIQLKVYNNTGSTINVGQPVYVTSTSSGYTYPNVALAIASSLTTGNVIGLANQAIPTGTAGYVTTIGLVQGVNTGSYTVGDTLYLSPYSAGYYQNTIPPTGYAIKLGTVAYVNSSNGAIYVNKSILTVQAGNIVGQVSLANGGTSANLTAVAGGIVYSGASALAISAAGTTGQFLQSNGSGAPTWATPVSYASVTDDTTTNGTRYPLFANQTSGSLSTEYTSSTKLQYNPSTGVFTSTSFSGAGTGLTGTASSLSIGGNAATATSATSSTTATNLAGGANGSLPYQTASGTTTFLAASTNGYLLTLSGGVPTWAAASASSIAISDDTSSATAYYPLFARATSGSVTTEYTSSTKLTYTPSTGTLTATTFSGSISGSNVSGNISGNAANVTGVVALANGGTNANLTAVAGGAVYSTGSALAITAAGTSGQVLTSNGSSAPTWTTVSVTPNVTNKTTTYSIATTDGSIFCNATSAAFTVTLPTAVGVGGKTYSIKKTDNSTNAIIIATTSSQTIDGLTTQTLGIYNAWLTLQSDGSNWQIIG